MIQPSRAYIVCSTQRSGSTYLCHLLASTGVAGNPQEYFEARADTGLPPHPGYFLAGLSRTGAGIRDDLRPTDAPGYSDLRTVDGWEAHLERTFRLGTTANGVVATKLMWNQLPDLEQHAAALPPFVGVTGAELLERLFAHPSYVWMRRSDKVRQAISLWRALQTRIWRLEHPTADGEKPALHYSFDGIEHLRRRLSADDDAWGRFFERSALDPLELRYETDVEPDPMGAVARVLAHSVLNALHDTRLDERTLVICTTDHGLAFPTAKASLLDRGIGVSLVLRGPGFTGGRALDELVSHIDIFPTVCDVAGVPTPPWALGRSLVPLVAGDEEPGVRAAIFSELTYHAAYEPQRAIRTERYKYIRRFDDYPYPVLPNCDDSPSKDAHLTRGWATRVVARESLHDLFFNPGEGRNLIGEADYAGVLGGLRERLHQWMVETSDPLLKGPIAPPVGARINSQSQRSAEDPTQLIEETEAPTSR
ncbi:MAG TPA: Stf0 family sulfotransferase [Solirubrobacteraceae bacterium]|nr:Stf0 family sulfotransferase [Solirubrobacteraceae bacterium]